MTNNNIQIYNFPSTYKKSNKNKNSTKYLCIINGTQNFQILNKQKLENQRFEGEI
mgnify:CR=1 FL=1